MRVIDLLLLLFAALALMITGGVLVSSGETTALATVSMMLGTGALLALLLRNADAIRRLLTGREAAYGAGTLFMVAMVLAISIFAYLFLERYKQRFDLTEGKLFSLAPQTLQVLQSLERPVHVVAIDTQGDETSGWALSKQLMELYRHAGGDKFSYEMIDSQKTPAALEKYRDYLAGYETPPVFLLTLRDQAGNLSVEKITNRQEETLTNGLIKLTKKINKRVYFTQGHGERGFDDHEAGENMVMAKRALTTQGYLVEALDTLRHEEMPPDADIIVIAGPQSDFYPHELKALDMFLDRGGDLLLLLDAQHAPELAAWASARFGLVIGNDVVVEHNPINQLFGLDPTQALIESLNPDHDITRGLHRERARLRFAYARSVRVNDEAEVARKADWLLRTSEDKSWAETDWIRFREGTAAKDAADVPGPVPVAVAVVLDATAVIADATAAEQPTATTARVVVAGSSSFISDKFMSSTQLQSPALLNNMINWLAGEDDLIAIPPRQNRDTSVILSRAQINGITFILCVAVPGLFLIAGVTVFLSHRETE